MPDAKFSMTNRVNAFRTRCSVKRVGWRLRARNGHTGARCRRYDTSIQQMCVSPIAVRPALTSGATGCFAGCDDHHAAQGTGVASRRFDRARQRAKAAWRCSIPQNSASVFPSVGPTVELTAKFTFSCWCRSRFSETIWLKTGLAGRSSELAGPGCENSS